jgi:hypothetical protein
LPPVDGTAGNELSVQLPTINGVRSFAMLRANVGLSRKITRDFNSTGYSVNLDGEIPFSVDDPEAITEKVKELFSLAQEALAQEIDRDQGEDAIGRRDEERPQQPKPATNGNGNGHADRPANGNVPANRPSNAPAPRSTPANGAGAQNGQEEPATNKQVQFLLTMGKRLKLSTPQMEGKITEITGRRCGVYDLTKKEAGFVLDQFTKGANANGNGRQGK